MATNTAASKKAIRVDKSKRFYFLHGDDEAAMELAKTQIVDAHLDRDQREENYREILPSGSPPSLKRVMDDVMSELSTVSFLPDIKRVVTLYTVNDFFEAKTAKSRSAKGKKKAEAEPKKSASEHFTHFLKTELPSLPAVLIVFALEDYEKWKKIAPANPVVQFAQFQGAVYAFKDDSPQFAFFDALFTRQTVKAITLWRDWLRRTGTSPKPYLQLCAQLRLMIQAKTAASGQLQSKGVTKQKFMQEFMPSEFDKNFFALRSDWQKDKMTKAAGNFTFPELLRAYENLMPLQKFVIPMQSDPYVPDKPLLAELWIMQFTASAKSPAAV